LFALGVVELVDGMLVLADAYGLHLLAAPVLAGIVVASMYVWRSQKRRRHRRWFEEGLRLPLQLLTLPVGPPNRTLSFAPSRRPCGPAGRTKRSSSGAEGFSASKAGRELHKR
jgi:hypothetical protein